MPRQFKSGKDESAIPVAEFNRPDQYTTSDADAVGYVRWKTPGDFDASDVFTEDHDAKVVILRNTISSGVAKNEGAFDTWANRAVANYVPWSLVQNIIK